MKDCIFCRIVAGDIPCRKVYEDDAVLAFEDIHPMAPVHVVVVPKRHVATLMELRPGGEGGSDALVAAVQEVARSKGIAEKGFRMVVNCNEQGGQVVFHLHVHVLGGRVLRDELG